MITLGVGLHPDVPEDVYHRDPAPQASLSSTVAREILRSPMHARFLHPRLNPNWTAEEKTDRARDMGSAAHALMLGAGRGLRIIDAADYKKDAPKKAAAEARAEGLIPLLKPDAEDVHAMVECGRDQLARTEYAGIFDHDGDAELTMVWQDGPTWCRSRIDYLPAIVRHGGHVVVPDYKTTAGSAHPDDWERTLSDKNYAFQAAFYERGLRTLIPAIRSVEFIFVVQEQDPPYGLSVVGIESEPLERARQDVEIALHLWRHCLGNDDWPGYTRRLVRIGAPATRAERHEFRNASLLDRLARWQAPLHNRKGEAA